MQNKISIELEACKRGDSRAQMVLYDNYCKAMYNVACRYLNDEDAKDAMQEGFLKAFTKIESYSNTYSFGAWLKRIIINQCIDVLKKRRIETTPFEEANLKIVDDTNWKVDTSISKEMIVSSIEMLPDRYQLVVKLYLMEGYDHQEISQILGIPVKTSRTHLRRGKQQLQELLKTQRHGTGY